MHTAPLQLEARLVEWCDDHVLRIVLTVAASCFVAQRAVEHAAACRCAAWERRRCASLATHAISLVHALVCSARASLIPSLCTHFTRAGIEWRR